ncbi:MAG: WD40 repeat domain-containing protein [Cyanobacteria bacterium SID2]|nr:WD40 repeat domain-containing protein [Cyanobacteria bacterium SID2]
MLQVDLERHNDRLLRELAFAIEAARGQFKLMFARCNYDRLRSDLLNRLRERSAVEIPDLRLPPEACSLFHGVRQAAKKRQPDVLSVCGLDNIAEIDRLLQSTNQVREEFRKCFPFPILLWVNDELLAKLARLVPDFESWGTTYDFNLSADEILNWLFDRSERAFQTILNASPTAFLIVTPLVEDRDRQELRTALQTLQKRHVALEPSLSARIQFLVGRNAYERERLDTARRYFQQSLEFWHQQPETADVLEKQAVLLLHLGLADVRGRGGVSSPTHENDELPDRALTYFHQSLETFERASRHDCVARAITLAGEILDRLGKWDELRSIAHRAIELHKKYGSLVQLAVDYGVLAKIATLEQRWYRAHLWADKALQLLAQQTVATPDDLAPYQDLLAQQYRLYIVTAQKHLERGDRAQRDLELTLRELPQALRDPAQQIDPHRYLYLLDCVRESYSEHSQYRAAFYIKQHQRSIEQQYGFRTFIGAGQLKPHRQTVSPGRLHQEPIEHISPEILASPRQWDVDRLLERIARPDRKLITLYGPSGVGKSSTIDAGLIPALRQTTFATRQAVPVVLRLYGNWLDRLRRKLFNALSRVNAKSIAVKYLAPTEDSTIDRFINALKSAVDRNLFVVLVFDQFEEFFFVYPNAQKRRLFYEFLDCCLDIPYLTVILSLREDYLHYLLECDRQIAIDAIDLDILNKENRYYLSSFSPDDTRQLLHHLTATRPYLSLEPELIDELVRDLAAETDDVRPIELQIVGAQLQHDNINTLDKYRQLGANPKQELVERFLKDAVRDCGRENEAFARQLLYSLTDKQGNRPIKTYPDLQREVGCDADTLDFVLEIVVESGLVYLLPEVPNNRYQLVHDYLVSFIRQQQEQAETQETAVLRARNRQLSEERDLLEQLTEAQARQRQTDNRFKRVLAAGVIVLGVAAGFAYWKSRQAVWAERRTDIAKDNARSALARLSSNPDFLLALVQSLHAGHKTARLDPPPSRSIKSQTVRNLQQSLEAIVERNRLEGHRQSVVDVSFSPDGSFLATASWDNTVRLWGKNGELLHILEGHSKPVTAVSVSQDSQSIASGSEDGTVKLWTRDGTHPTTLAPNATVTSLSFSPDGKQLAVGLEEGVVQLWTVEGQQLREWKAHEGLVLAVAFSVGSNTLWTTGPGGKAIEWTLGGQQRLTLTGHTHAVMGIALSPDGNSIATVSTDRTLKIWNRDGKLRQSLEDAHSLLDVAFSPDGQSIATTSADRTVKLWNLDGTLGQTLTGHRDRVWAVSFSPDGDALATASTDNTARLWQLHKTAPTRFSEHRDAVWAVGFSPDGETLATASADETVKLWDLQGNVRQTLTGHLDRVLSVAFSPDGSLMASASADGTARLWRVDDGTTSNVLNHDDSVKSASFSPDGTLLATASRDGTVRIWRVSDGVQVRSIPAHESQVNCVMWTPDGSTLVSASEDGTIALWRVDGLLKQRIATESPVYWVSVSPDGQTVAAVGADNTVKLWSIDGRFLHNFEGHTASVNWVSFSPDGESIASASNDRTVKLWQLDGTRLDDFEAHTDNILSIAFHPQGHLLATAAKDGTAKLWLLPTPENLAILLERGCDWARDYLETNPRLQMDDRDLCQAR